MAVDKLSDHYTSTDNYRDIDGNMKTFTFIDHDKKTKIGTSKITEEEFSEARKSVIESRKKLQEEVLSLPAYLCPREYQDFTLRKEGEGGAQWDEWNEDMIKDQGMTYEKLYNICTLIKNRIEIERLTI